MLYELQVCWLVLQLFGAYGGVLDLGVAWGCLLRQQLLLFVVLTKSRYRFALVVVSALTGGSVKPALKILTRAAMILGTRKAVTGALNRELYQGLRRSLHLHSQQSGTSWCEGHPAPSPALATGTELPFLRPQPASTYLWRLPLPLKESGKWGYS